MMNAPVTHPIDHIGVIIPARDEEALLPRCLDSILHAQTALPPDVTCDIVVAVDRSTDGTKEIARSMLQGFGTAISTSAGVVGLARAKAAQLALRRFRGNPARCWLANTDADCVVPENWLVEQLLLARSGAQAVAGIVDVDDFSEHHVGLAQRFYESYLIHQDGTHPHVHGANIGMRADVYLRAGGWASLATAEDHDLWNRLSDFDCHKLSVARLKVVTSGRRVGRAPAGFAQALAAHNEAFA
jgi:glycosyltransferase involved in cell wall biosynthesis